MQWLRHDPAKRRNVMMQILPYIRLPFLDPSFVQGAMECDEFTAADMRHCREYLSNVHAGLTAHRHRCLPRFRAPIKPLVICMRKSIERQEDK